MALWTHEYGERTCPICDKTFIARQMTSKYCGGTCQVMSYQKKYAHVRKRRQTVHCYCPVCTLELIGSRSLKRDTKNGATFKCARCKALSVWALDVIPAPLLIKHQKVGGQLYEVTNT